MTLQRVRGKEEREREAERKRGNEYWNENFMTVSSSVSGWREIANSDYSQILFVLFLILDKEQHVHVLIEMN